MHKRDEIHNTYDPQTIRFISLRQAFSNLLRGKDKLEFGNIVDSLPVIEAKLVEVINAHPLVASGEISMDILIEKAEKIFQDKKQKTEDARPLEGIDYSEKKEKPIWKEDREGNRRGLNHTNVAWNLMLKNFYITIGTSKSETYFYKDGVYVEGGCKAIAQAVQKISEGKCRNNDINEIVGQVQRETFQDRECLFGQDENKICLNNGILDLKKKELKSHSEQEIFTHKLSIDYDPKADCPKIKNFLAEILPEEDIALVQELAGYLLLRKYPYKKAFIFVGPKDSGKTSIIKLLVKFIGAENTSGVSLHRLLIDKFASGDLNNKLLNFYDDLDFRDLRATGCFKIATGGGYLSGEKKFGERFNFLNYAKLLFAANKISAVDDTDDMAYYGRWIIIFFNNIFSRKKNNLKPDVVEEITTDKEMQGMLNWAVKGLHRLWKNNGFSYNLTPEENRELMEKSSSSLSAFVFECLERKDDSWISKEEMYQLYSLYVEEKNLERITKDMLGKQLQQKAKYVIDSRRDCMIQGTKKKRVRGWLNVDLKASCTEFFQLIFNKYNINFQIYNKLKGVTPGPSVYNKRPPFLFPVELFKFFDKNLPKNQPKSTKNQPKSAKIGVKETLHFSLENYPKSNFPCSYPVGEEEHCGNTDTYLCDNMYFCVKHLERWEGGDQSAQK